MVHRIDLAGHQCPDCPAPEGGACLCRLWGANEARLDRLLDRQQMQARTLDRIERGINGAIVATYVLVAAIVGPAIGLACWLFG